MKEAVFSGVFSFLMIAFVQWMVAKKKSFLTKKIQFFWILIFIPIITVGVFKIPYRLEVGIYTSTPVIWGIIVLLSSVIDPMSAVFTRSIIVWASLIFSILLFAILPSVRIVLVSSIFGIISGLVTVYFWKWKNNRAKDLVSKKNMWATPKFVLFINSIFK